MFRLMYLFGYSKFYQSIDQITSQDQLRPGPEGAEPTPDAIKTPDLVHTRKFSLNPAHSIGPRTLGVKLAVADSIHVLVIVDVLLLLVLYIIKYC